jgi:hypothetical protein
MNEITHRPSDPDRTPLPAFMQLAGIAILALLMPGCGTDGPMTEAPHAAVPFQPREVPEFVQKNLEEITAKDLAGRQWPKVKIPGREEQVHDAQVNGIDCVWQNISPGYANVVYDAKVDNGVITITLDGGALAQSADGGKTWRQISYGLSNSASYQSFDISPTNPQLIISAGGYLDKTLDGGQTWSKIFDPNLPPFSLGRNTIFDKVRFNADGTRVFASLGSFGHGLEPRGYETHLKNVFKTKRVYVGDGTGSNFSAFELGPFAGIRAIYPHPEKPDLVYLSFADGELYVTRNATAPTPTFQQLGGLPAGLVAIDIDASPWQDGELLLTLMPVADKTATPFKVVLAKDAGTKVLTCTEVSVKDAAGKPLRVDRPVMAKWNPRVRGQVFIAAQANGLLVSDDEMKSFRIIPFPAELKHDEPTDANGNAFCFNTQRICFDRKTDLALTCSAIAGWYSTDQFKTWNDLLMTFDPEKRLYGNKGAGFAECGNSIFIRKNCTYLATNDHGIFRSDGADITKWRRISGNPGIPRWGKNLYSPMCVSDDEKYVYIFARDAGAPGGNYNNSPTVKLLLSLDRGESWQDVTTRLGHGETLDFERKTPYGCRIEMLIDPRDSDRQWIMFTHHLFFSGDGGKTFHELDSPLFTRKDGAAFREMDYDPTHRILYVGNAVDFPGGSGLARSRDFGTTWEIVRFGSGGGIKGFAVTDSGTLVIGLDGKLVVIPYDQIDAGRIEPEMVKMTIGDTVEEWAAAQKAFGPIACDGEDIVVFACNSSLSSNYAYGLGPLLSQDGGKTFRWITYNLPCTEKGFVALGNGTIIIGNRGIYGWRYKGE